ncbi:hypothetical protein ACIOWG_23415 [Streptomyces sp. NPDC087658]
MATDSDPGKYRPLWASAVAGILALSTALTSGSSAYGATVAATAATCLEGQKDSRGRSSVDGTEIAWEDETRYDDARIHATAVWTANGLNRISFPRDDSFRIADLEWSDINETTGQWKNVGAAWTALPGTDRIRMNSAYLGAGKKYGSTAQRRQVAAHELGHALGFCHKSPDWYPTLMAPNAYDGPSDGRPTSRDRANYHDLWG